MPGTGARAGAADAGNFCASRVSTSGRPTLAFSVVVSLARAPSPRYLTCCRRMYNTLHRGCHTLPRSFPNFSLLPSLQAAPHDAHHPRIGLDTTAWKRPHTHTHTHTTPIGPTLPSKLKAQDRQSSLSDRHHVAPFESHQLVPRTRSPANDWALGFLPAEAGLGQADEPVPVGRCRDVSRAAAAGRGRGRLHLSAQDTLRHCHRLVRQDGPGTTRSC